jgi:hypothetical protein
MARKVGMPVSPVSAPPKQPGFGAANKAVMAAPRLKPSSTREYGKGGTPYSANLQNTQYGAGTGYGGPYGTT